MAHKASDEMTPQMEVDRLGVDLADFHQAMKTLTGRAQHLGEDVQDQIELERLADAARDAGFRLARQDGVDVVLAPFYGAERDLDVLLPLNNWMERRKASAEALAAKLTAPPGLPVGTGHVVIPPGDKLLVETMRLPRSTEPLDDDGLARMGLATTAQLLDELRARAELGGYAEYRTVDEPDLEPLVRIPAAMSFLEVVRESPFLRRAIQKLLAGCLVQLVADLTTREVADTPHSGYTLGVWAESIMRQGALVLGHPFHAPPFFDAVTEWVQQRTGLDLGEEDGLNLWQKYGFQEQQLRSTPGVGEKPGHRWPNAEAQYGPVDEDVEEDEAIEGVNILALIARLRHVDRVLIDCSYTGPDLETAKPTANTAVAVTVGDRSLEDGVHAESCKDSLLEALQACWDTIRGGGR